MPPVLVVGSNSFSGASFVDYLLEQGQRVIGTSRSLEPIDAMLPYKWRDHQNFDFHKLDLNKDLNKIADLVHAEKPEYVINFAAQSMVGESWNSPEDWFMTNAVSTVKLHDALRKLDFLKRYVHISTPEVYGSCEGFVKEDFPFNPSTPYAVSRAAADMSLRTFRAAYDFPVVTTRAANVYGPGQQLYRIIPRTILFILLGKRLQLHGGGESTRSFIHMHDVSDATWKIAQHGINGETYHISTNEVISIKDLVAKICKKLGARYEDHVQIVGERLGKDSAYHLDSTKVRSELGWSDKITLEQGIDECIKWVRKNIEILRDEPMNYIHKV
ncbi:MULTISPECIES: GDP-mannose 4,6-dehydratase [unclassified Polynucleobacter]|uniref:dTDP-glucose 4,6-dehydratase n=1 Tax=unclassified Polynucleobacter TaxID=2640945 RepID=UPI0008B4A9A6|nr:MULTISPECIES: GDP-mannose 4,6-dehydratase [unclassified Polynucleobacter]OHC09840.1 MAG: dTDP-glucose 4,6-dehydratase [Polynucleobacter sp. GWA2_45_21]HBK42802.1 dTDP-glucose 4,6-dehydratase [Polynucleobacter sp.]